MEPLDPLDQLLRGRTAAPVWSGLAERVSAWVAERWPWLVAAAAIAGIAVAVLVVRTPGPAPAVVLPRATAEPPGSTAPPASAAGPGAGASRPATTVPGSVVVHVAGAVVHPGLVTLPGGSRVADAVAAAGGEAPDADGDRINLAAPLADGVRVYIPSIGQDAPPDVAVSGGGAVGAGGAPGAGTVPTGPVDLNSATAAQLDALPGVGPATSEAIIEYRTEHRRFRSVDELQDVSGIGPAKFERLRPLVTAGS